MADPWATGLANTQGYKNEIPAAQPRPLVLKEASQSSLQSSAAAETGSKRQVSSNACEPCRKRKSKCDGLKPFCFSCTSLHMTPCYYDLNKDLRRKGALRQEIKRLKNKSNNYQFIIDSLCLAEEPYLSQLIQLIRSNQSIEAIADAWRSSDFPLLKQLQASFLLEIDGINGGNNLGNPSGAPPFMEMATNQTNINIGQSSVQTNQPSINISGSNIQIHQPGPPFSSFPGIAGIPEIPGALGIAGVPVMPDQVGVPLDQSMNEDVIARAEESQRAPLNLNGWYDEWGRLWPTF